MARIQGIVIAGLSIMAGSFPALAQDAAAPLAPVPLFTQVCTAGGGHLSKDAVRPVAYGQLPSEVRQAMGFAGPKPGTAPFETMPQVDVPNRLMKVGGTTYLVLPAPDQGGAMASSCAVVWRGRNFAAARDAMYAIAGVKSPPADADISPIADTHIAQVSGPGFNLFATEIAGWTMLREAPPSTPVARPVSSSSVQNPGMKVRQKDNGETVVTSH